MTKNVKKKEKYENGGRGPKNPNVKGGSRKGKFRNFGDDYPSANDVKPGKFANPGRINDIKWYVSNDQMLNDVARIPYNIPVGMPIDNHGLLTSVPARDILYSVPGVVVLNVIPSYGWAQDPSDPVNVAFSGMFTYIRSHTSSKFDWDDNTLAINMLAADSLYYMITWAQRLYGTLPLFHQSNKYLPQSLIEAQGVDYDDLLANAAKFRAEINMRIARINALKIPSELYVFARHKWLFESYYIEGPSTKDQIYMYKPAAYYIHTKDSNGLSKLSCHRTLSGGTGYGGRLTAADIIRKIDAMLDPIFNDQYFNLISGYIEQAYEGKVMSLSYLPDQMVMPLVYSEEVLVQFQNTKAYPVKHDSGSGYYNGAFDVEQQPASATDIRVCLKVKLGRSALMVYRQINDGLAIDVDSSSSTDQQYNMYTIVNEYSKRNLFVSPHSDVTPAESMINTRNAPAMRWEDTSSGAPSVGFVYAQWGTEWPVSFQVFTRCYDVNTLTYYLEEHELHNVMYYDPADVNGHWVTTRYLPLISKFKYLPEVKLVTRYLDATTDPTAVSPCDVSYFQIDNYTLVDSDTLYMMHNSAKLAMLRVPEIASTALSNR